MTKKRFSKWPILDGQLEEVPEEHQATFAGRRRMVQWTLRLMSLRMKLLDAKREPWAEFIPVEKVAAELQRCITEVTSGLPFVPCDCKPTDTWCPKCQNRGWLPDPIATYSSAVRSTNGQKRNGEAGRNGHS